MTHQPDDSTVISGLARLAFCCGFVALLSAFTPLGIVFGVLAVKYGRLAASEMDLHGPGLVGEQLARQGFYLGYAVLVFSSALMFLLMMAVLLAFL
jgi:hypothetical protein